MTKNYPSPSLRDPIYSSSENGKLGHSWLKNHQFLIGNTSSNGPFSIAMLVYWNLNTMRFRGDDTPLAHHVTFGEPGS